MAILFMNLEVFSEDTPRAVLWVKWLYKGNWKAGGGKWENRNKKIVEKVACAETRQLVLEAHRDLIYDNVVLSPFSLPVIYIPNTIRDEMWYECMRNLMHAPSIFHCMSLPQSGSHFTHAAFINGLQ